MPAGSDERRRLLLAAIAALCAGLIAWSLVLRANDPARVNHDVAWHVYAGGVLLEGGRLGVDVVDNNPPLVYWLAAAVVAPARALGVAPLVAYYLVVFGLVLLSALLVRRLLRDVLAPPWPEVLGLALLGLLALAPGYQFAQRDHVLAVLMLPYLVAAGLALAWRRPHGPLAWWVGGLAGFGIALKPHYVLLFLGVELMLLVRAPGERLWRRPENLAMLGLGAIYVGAVWLLAPSFFEVARDALEVYGAYDRSVDLLSVASVLTAVALLVAIVARLPEALARAVETLALAAFLAVGMVFLQGKGFGYHEVPARSFALFALVLAVVALVSAPGFWSRGFRVSPAWLAGLGLLLWVGTTLNVVRQPLWRRSGVAKLAEFIEEGARGGPVLAFTASVDPFFPALNFTTSRSASPYSCLWLIAGRYPGRRAGLDFAYRDLEQMGDGERRFVDSVVESVEQQRPRLLLFDATRTKQGFRGVDFDFRRYFEADPRFRRALRRYRHLGKKRFLTDGWRSFEVYLRTDPR